MLPKVFRLKKRTEFAYSYKHGKNYNFENINIVVFKRRDNLLRIGFSVSKKVGKAVIRNKVKRQFRSILNKNLNNITKGFNIIFIAKPSILNLSFIDMQKEVEESLKKCLSK